MTQYHIYNVSVKMHYIIVPSDNNQWEEYFRSMFKFSHLLIKDCLSD